MFLCYTYAWNNILWVLKSFCFNCSGLVHFIFDSAYSLSTAKRQIQIYNASTNFWWVKSLVNGISFTKPSRSQLFFDLVVHIIFYAGIYCIFMVAAIQIDAAPLFRLMLLYYLWQWLVKTFSEIGLISITATLSLNEKSFTNAMPIYGSHHYFTMMAANATWQLPDYSGLPCTCKWHCMWLPWWLETNQVNILSKNESLLLQLVQKSVPTFHYQTSWYSNN